MSSGTSSSFGCSERSSKSWRICSTTIQGCAPMPPIAACIAGPWPSIGSELIRPTIFCFGLVRLWTSLVTSYSRNCSRSAVKNGMTSSSSTEFVPARPK